MRTDREVGEFEANAWQSGHDAGELDIAEGDGSDQTGCLHAPASLQSVQSSRTEQTHCLAVQLGHVALRQRQTLHTGAPCLLEPGNDKRVIRESI